MHKRTRNRSSLLSLGVKRIRCGGNGGENGQAESASEQPADDPHDDGRNDRHDHPDQDDTDTIDKIMECSSDCCKPDLEGPNQPKSCLILSATKRVQSRQAQYVEEGSANIPGSLCVRQEVSFLLLLNC